MDSGHVSGNAIDRGRMLARSTGTRGTICRAALRTTLHRCVVVSGIHAARSAA